MSLRLTALERRFTPLAGLCIIVALSIPSSSSEKPLSSPDIDLAATEVDLEFVLRACPAASSRIDSAATKVDLAWVLRPSPAVWPRIDPAAMDVDLGLVLRTG